MSVRPTHVQHSNFDYSTCDVHIAYVKNCTEFAVKSTRLRHISNYIPPKIFEQDAYNKSRRMFMTALMSNLTGKKKNETKHSNDLSYS